MIKTVGQMVVKLNRWYSNGGSCPIRGNGENMRNHRESEAETMNVSLRQLYCSC